MQEILTLLIVLALHWRMLAGLATTLALCSGIVASIDNDALELALSIPAGLAGTLATLGWQLRADFAAIRRH